MSVLVGNKRVVFVSVVLFHVYVTEIYFFISLDIFCEIILARFLSHVFCGGGASGSGRSRISQRVASTHEGAPTYYLTNYSRKLHENEEMLAQTRGPASLTTPLPPRSANERGGRDQSDRNLKNAFQWYSTNWRHFSRPFFKFTSENTFSNLTCERELLTRMLKAVVIIGLCMRQWSQEMVGHIGARTTSFPFILNLILSTHSNVL